MAYSNNAVSKPQERLWPLDLLRILATFGIVLLHVSPLPAEYAVVDTLPWQVSISISILFRWCVPVFLMISGVLFLSPWKSLSVSRLYRKNILRIVTCFIFWSAFYAVVYCLLNGKGKWTFLNQLLRGHYHMWYIFITLGLYMLTPLLRKITENKRATEYFLVLGLIWIFLLPRLLSFIQIFMLPHADVIASLQSAVTQANPFSGSCAMYYYVLGYYLYAYPVRTKERRAMIAAGAIGCMLTCILTLWHSTLAGENTGRFYGIDSISVLAMSVGVFVLFKHMFAQFNPTAQLERVLLILSACSFGIYLVHPFLIERLQITLPPSPVVLIIGTPIVALGIYALSLCIIFLLRGVPVLRRYIV